MEHSYERADLAAKLFRRSRIQRKSEGNAAVNVSGVTSTKTNEINRLSLSEVFVKTEIES